MALNSEYIGNIAVILTILLNCTGILTCRKIISDKSVGSLNYIPFLSGIVMFSYWLLYGYAVNDHPLIFVNAIGVCLQVIYFSIYCAYTENKYPVVRSGVLSTVFILSALTAVIIVQPVSRIVTGLGLICNVLSVLFFASPLSDMQRVFKTKSTESMSFPLTFMSVLVTSSWALYGHLINDYLVLFPNTLGLILSLIQVSLFVKFPKRQSSSPLPQ